jgi:uncharacterized protein (TIGR03083 family)
MDVSSHDRHRDDETLALTSAEADELLGAYALDALDADELAAVEAAIARDPELARAAERLVDAAAWIGATEALVPPSRSRAGLIDRARARRSGARDDVAARTYRASTARLAETLPTLEPVDYDAPTPNGLSAHDLVVHLAAQESMLAQVIGRPVVPDIEEHDIDRRTSAFVERYRDEPIEAVHDVWRRSVDAVLGWVEDPSSRDAVVPWLGLDMPRDNFLVARAFENWIHRDDLRRAQGRPIEAPSAEELHAMADVSLRTLPFALLVSDRAHPGKVASVVLTGAGGGEWRVSTGGRGADLADPVDVTLTTDVVDWCLWVGERIDRDDLAVTVEGDEALAADLVSAAPTFATL